MDFQTIGHILTINWYYRKVEEPNLWDYSNILEVEVLELNGFGRFRLDGRVFLQNCHL